MSLYQLTIENNTPFFIQNKNKEFILPDDDIILNLMEINNNIAKKYNLHRYEISNYAIKGKESLHNNCYWHGDDYIGIGPGAHGRISVNDKILCNRTRKKT